MKKIFWLSPIILILFLASACAKPGSSSPAPTPTPTSSYNQPMQVGPKQIQVQIASTEQTRAQGLSGRSQLTDDQGMLFTFGQSVMPAFWMKQMNFGLDFIWISQNKIIGITLDVPPPQTATSTLPLYYPPSAVDSVLEVNAGWSQRYGLEVGDVAKLVDQK